MAEQFGIPFLERDKRIILICPEEMNHDYSRVLKKNVTNWLNDGVKDIDFDLRKTQSVDSYSLGTMIQTLRRLREANGSVRLCEPNIELQNLFSLTGFDKIFEIAITELN